MVFVFGSLKEDPRYKLFLYDLLWLWANVKELQPQLGSKGKDLRLALKDLKIVNLLKLFDCIS